MTGDTATVWSSTNDQPPFEPYEVDPASEGKVLAGLGRPAGAASVSERRTKCLRKRDGSAGCNPPGRQCSHEGANDGVLGQGRLAVALIEGSSPPAAAPGPPCDIRERDSCCQSVG